MAIHFVRKVHVLFDFTWPGNEGRGFKAEETEREQAEP